MCFVSVRARRFNIINFEKRDSIYNQGMRPTMFSYLSHKHHGVGWRRAAEAVDICYFRNCHLKPVNVELAAAAAARSEVAGVSDDAQRVRFLYQAIHARAPDETELALAVKFLGSASAPGGGLSVLPLWVVADSRCRCIYREDGPRLRGCSVRTYSPRQ